MATTKNTISEKHNAAVSKALLAEENGKSESTQNRLWREVFRLEDEMKNATGGWSR